MILDARFHRSFFSLYSCICLLPIKQMSSNVASLVITLLQLLLLLLQPDLVPPNMLDGGDDDFLLAVMVHKRLPLSFVELGLMPVLTEGRREYHLSSATGHLSVLPPPMEKWDSCLGKASSSAISPTKASPPVVCYCVATSVRMVKSLNAL
jgi:hypothetical protein